MQGLGISGHAEMDMDQQGESCHQQANDQRSDDSGPVLDCPSSALCALASAMPFSASSVTVVASGSFAVSLPLSSGFLSADSTSLFRPPIA